MRKNQIYSKKKFGACMLTNLRIAPLLKPHPEFLILHIGTNDTSKYLPNEIVDEVLALKRFVVSPNEECKVLFQY